MNELEFILNSIEEGLYEKFTYYFTEANFHSSILSYIEMHGPRNLIVSTFPWYYTKEGSDFWQDVNYKYKAKLHNYHKGKI